MVMNGNYNKLNFYVPVSPKSKKIKNKNKKINPQKCFYDVTKVIREKEVKYAVTFSAIVIETH